MTMPRKPQGRRALALNFALMLVVAVCALLFVWRWIDQPAATIKPADATVSAPAQRHDRSPEGIDNTADDPGRRAPETKASSTAVGPDSGELVLQFLERAQQGLRPAAALAFTVEIVTAARGKQLPQETDQKGYATITGPRGAAAMIRLPDTGWRFASHGLVGGTETTISLSRTAPSDDMTLIVERAQSLALSISYSDGVAYTGLITVLSASGQPLSLEVQSTPVRMALRPDQEFRVLVPSRRPGFADKEVALKPSSVQAPQLITLEESARDFGMLEISCTGAEAGALVDIYVDEVPTDAADAARRQLQHDRARRWSSDKSYTTCSLSEAKFVVVVRPYHAQSNLIGRAEASVLAGVTVRVHVVLELQASVRARVVQVNGTPVPRARLALGEETHVKWDWVDTLPAGFGQAGEYPMALAGADGVATLSGLLPGSLRVLCDARGLAQKQFEITLAPGECHDLGTVTLSKAEGRIVIVVHHPQAAEDAEYEIMLLKPLGGVVFGPKAYVGKRIVIDGLALLAHTISIRYVGGGFGATSQNVALTASSPSAEVEFAMKRPGE